ncbi:HdeD family acid-resistance protein [Dictyobacter aurantiacus]|uniref:HdeD family acid-resistance protein n=1 Tax=Dictyobacter aurantiacus TaxID=1936993 RepID=A0A401ZF19_9CHLR|nr:HdeD family acid-resistance protein [Dictyobacter aurantiacus]GCE05436.1 hypothetical protein KDAU_27650 [Dictyobacter aurantiacus]
MDTQIPGMSSRTYTAIPWWIAMMEGIALIIVGLLLLFSPAMTTLVLVQVLGWYWLIGGILSFVSIFVDKTQWGWKLVIGILGVLAGLAVVRHPLWSALMIPTLIVICLAVQALIVGAVELIQGFSGGGVAAVMLGIINILLGIVLLFSPLSAAIVLPLVVGIFALIGGIIALFGAFRLKKQPELTAPRPSVI